MKRFYKEASVDETADGWRVLLDGKPMRTPAKTMMVVPTETLARAIAAEWDAVPADAELQVTYLALTRLAATALDRVPTQRVQVVDGTVKYAGSDLLCYRATQPESLVQRQRATWQPLLDWAKDRYGAELVTTEGASFVSQPHQALARLRAAVEAHSDAALAALYNLTHVAGSLVIALALAEGRLTAEQAFVAAQLDELYQVERWGDDPTAAEQQAGVRGDIEAGSRFLALLGDARLKG